MFRLGKHGVWSTLTEYLAAILLGTVDAITYLILRWRVKLAKRCVSVHVKRRGCSGCGGSAGAVTSEPSVPAPLLRNDFGALEWNCESHARRGVLGSVRHRECEGESGE